MTKEEFESQYAARSDITVEELHKLGLFAVPCDCDYGGCQGWQMTNKERRRNERERERRTE